MPLPDRTDKAPVISLCDTTAAQMNGMQAKNKLHATLLRLMMLASAVTHATSKSRNGKINPGPPWSKCKKSEVSARI